MPAFVAAAPSPEYAAKLVATFQVPDPKILNFHVYISLKLSSLSEKTVSTQNKIDHWLNINLGIIDLQWYTNIPTEVTKLVSKTIESLTITF